MATPRPRSTIAGGERAVVAMHSWNSKNGPGLVFHDLLITEACQILYQEYQDGNRALVTAQAVRNIWNHAQLNPLWNRNSEDKLKATIRTLLNHRRFKFATGLRNDWPPSVPEPPYKWFKQMQDGTAHAGQMDPPVNQIPLSDMVLMVFRSNVRRMFAIRIARLLSEGQETFTSFSELDLNLLIFHLEDDDYGFDFNAQTETLFWTGNEDGHAFSINEQLPFEAALQIQYNSGAKNLNLYIVSSAIDPGSALPVNPATQPQSVNYPRPMESHGQYLFIQGPQTMTPALQTMTPTLQGDGNYGASNELPMRFDYPFNAHLISGTQDSDNNVSSAAQQTTGPLGTGPSVNDE